MASKEGDGQFRRLVFFNEYDLHHHKIDPTTAIANEDFGVAETLIRRNEYENEPIINLLDRADGFILWRKTEDTKYYLYMTYKEGGTLQQGTPLPLNDRTTLPDLNIHFDEVIYIMISTVDPRYTPGNPIIEPLPLRF